MAQLMQENMIAFFENGKFIQFVEKLGADYIAHSAFMAGYEVETDRYSFNVVSKDV